MGAMLSDALGKGIAPKGRSYEKPRPKPGFFFSSTDWCFDQKVTLQLLM